MLTSNSELQSKEDPEITAAKLEQLGENMRFYAENRFRQLTLLVAVLTVAIAGIGQYPAEETKVLDDISMKSVIAVLSLIFTTVMWIAEVRSTLMWRANRNEAPAIWPRWKNAFWNSWFNATVSTLVLYAVLYAGWYYCLIKWAHSCLFTLGFGVLGTLLIIFTIANYWPLLSEDW